MGNLLSILLPKPILLVISVIPIPGGTLVGDLLSILLPKPILLIIPIIPIPEGALMGDLLSILLPKPILLIILIIPIPGGALVGDLLSVLPKLVSFFKLLVVKGSPIGILHLNVPIIGVVSGNGSSGSGSNVLFLVTDKDTPLKRELHISYRQTWLCLPQQCHHHLFCHRGIVMLNHAGTRQLGHKFLSAVVFLLPVKCVFTEQDDDLLLFCLPYPVYSPNYLQKGIDIVCRF
jgi:hypothetical protein